MITSKRLPFITAVSVCVCLLFCGFIVYAANTFDTTRVTEYQKKIFGDAMITLELQVDKDEWQALLDNPQAKEWISADIIINGERFNSVGVRAKGNSSLSQGGGSHGGFSGSSGNISLQFKFNKFVKGQNYYGLDTFCVNNMMGDATYMKDYIAYDIMNYIGVDTPLANYATVSVNGEDYGFGIALERYDQAFLARVYGISAGELYNVKISMGRRGDFEDMWQNVENITPGRQRGNRSGPGRGGFDGGNGGGSLVYTDDSISSYSAIFENAVFTPSDKDKQRVITAIENLNNGTDLEKYLDVDAILRYFAGHTVVVNLDSYISNMQQNYYIYERGGKLTILPWDYNLSFGGFQSNNASDVVNFPIDTPVSGVSMESRPLLNKLLEVDEYRVKYHEYLQQIIEGYFESGLFESTILAVDEKINEYVKTDPAAFYSYEQYEASLPVLLELGRLRAESIKAQLDGTIPSTSSEQNAAETSLIDASTVDLSALGSMMAGGGMGQGGAKDEPGGLPGGGERAPSMPDGFPEGQQPGEWDGQKPEGGPFGGPDIWPGGETFDMNLMQQAMQIIMGAGGELNDEVKAALLQIGLTEEQIEMFTNMQGGGNMQGRGSPGMDGSNDFSGGNEAGGGQADPGQRFNRPERNNDGTMPSQTAADTGHLIFIGVLLLVLIGATIFIARPRKNAV